jgi:eukaryotic-like serine/threonine-protein kinase
LVAGRYRLLERVGAGGMATVYHARDERLKRDVAVKLIAERFAHVPRFVRCFRREGELCARLAHHNVVAILDAGFEPRDFIVMEYVDGIDAAALLQTGGRPTAAEAVHIVAQVCDALQHAHDRDVLHCDVAPGNILIARDGTAKLADFGLACGVVEIAAGRVANIAGTPGYIAPEVLRGNRSSPRSDLYSLGVVLHRLLAGPSRLRPAGGGVTLPGPTAAPHMPRLAELRPGLPATLIQAVQRALADDPESRQDSVAEFRAQLLGAPATPHRFERPRAELPAAA